MTKRKPTKASTAWPGATLWKLDDVKPYPHNARTHPPAQVDFLAAILLKYGPDQPIVVDDDGVILKGHGRRLSAAKAGMADFPVVQRFGLSADDKRAMRIADNQSALMSGWDNELVRFEVESLKRGGYDVTLLGFGEAQLVQFMTQPGPPGSFPQFGEDIETEFCCPNCRFVWSGRPDAGKLKPGAGESDDSMRVPVRRKADGKGRTRKGSKVPTASSLARPKASRKNKTAGVDDADRRGVNGPPAKR